MPHRVLIVDDEAIAVAYLSRFFTAKGYETAQASTGEEGLTVARRFSPDVVLLDLHLPDQDGISVLAALKQELPQTGVVMITGKGDVETAVRAMRNYADHFVLKPPDLDVLESIVARVACACRQRDELSYLRGRQELISSGNVSVMLPEDLVSQIRVLAQGASTSVLILGETGTGKGVVARLIHELSSRRLASFVDINCAGLSGPLLESELFGYEAGAFTGATSRKRGLVEVASGGSLFLDEIGDMPLETQAKLLKVLEDRSFRRVGGTQSVQVDLRIMAATNVDLPAAVRAGKFRSDLYYRLSVVPLSLPPLRARVDCIPPLVERFVEEFGRALGKPQVRPSPEVQRVFSAYRWPGNIRELRNTIERAVLLCQDDTIEPHHLPTELRSRHSPTEDTAQLLPLAEVEKTHIVRVLNAVGQNRSRAAEILGMHRATLITKIRRLGLD
jgi:two-component system, NtrC family, response regulator AtoC